MFKLYLVVKAVIANTDSIAGREETVEEAAGVGLDDDPAVAPSEEVTEVFAIVPAKIMVWKQTAAKQHEIIHEVPNVECSPWPQPRSRCGRSLATQQL